MKRMALDETDCHLCKPFPASGISFIYQPGLENAVQEMVAMRTQRDGAAPAPPLEFHPLREHQASPARLVELLQEAKAVLLDRGMADMEEYGDMLKWGLPRKGDGKVRSMHVYHPGWCSFSDRFRGTVHYHGGAIGSTILLGEMEHYTYEAKADPQGDRFHNGQPYTLTRHTSTQGAGLVYALPAMVPHWLKPTKLTLTSFEEDDNELMGDLVNPAEAVGLDEHVWTQEMADALLPELLRQIDAKLATLTILA